MRNPNSWRRRRSRTRAICSLQKLFHRHYCERDQTHVVQLDQRDFTTAGEIPLATRLWSIFCKPVTSKTGYQLHRGSGATPQARYVSGRVSSISGEVRDRIRRTICVGLTAFANPFRVEEAQLTLRAQ